MRENKYVRLDDVLTLLSDYCDEGYFGGMDEKTTTKPTHGSCCTCQGCGYDYDDCVCTHNSLIQDLKKVIIQKQIEEKSCE